MPSHPRNCRQVAIIKPEPLPTVAFDIFKRVYLPRRLERACLKDLQVSRIRFSRFDPQLPLPASTVCNSKAAQLSTHLIRRAVYRGVPRNLAQRQDPSAHGL